MCWCAVKKLLTHSRTWRFIVLAVGLLVEVGRIVVVEVTGMFRVSGDVVEVLTLVVGGTRHAATDDARCVGHSRRHRRVSRRCILALQGAQRCAIRLSSLQLHRLLTLSFIGEYVTSCSFGLYIVTLTKNALRNIHEINSWSFMSFGTMAFSWNAYGLYSISFLWSINWIQAT